MNALRPSAETARRRVRRLPGVLLALCLGVVACSGEPRIAALEELRATPDAFDGRPVIITGTLRTFGEAGTRAEHFWIENADLDRVGLEGAENLRALVGWTVEVRGTFRYDRTAGRRIEVAEIASAR